MNATITHGKAVPRGTLRVDFSSLTAPKEPEPRLIAEIYAEAGEFPFKVRKVRPTGPPSWPVGQQLDILAKSKWYAGAFVTSLVDEFGNVHAQDTRSWSLLGH